MAMLMVLIACGISINAQVASSVGQSASISVSITMEKDILVVGQKPRAIVTVKNISGQEICFSTASRLYRVHVEGKDGERSKTEYHRHLHGDFRSGDGPVVEDGPVICRDIASGASDVQTYDLSAFYDLSAPGKYSVYIEIYDPLGPKEGNGIWLRTNTAKFELRAPTQ
jgi:hypothetical protein